MLDGQGDRQSAARLYQKSVEVYRTTGDLWGITHPLCDLAWLIWDQGNLSEARSLMEEYLYAFNQTSSMEGAAMALGYLATMSAATGDFEAALRSARESMRIKRTIKWGQEAGIVHDIAWVYFSQGKLPEARQAIEPVLSSARKARDKKPLASILLLLGHIACYEGRIEEGKKYLEECLNLTEPWDELRKAEIMLGLGHAACLQGDIAEAAAFFRQSLEKRQGSLPALPGRYEKLAYLALRQEQAARAASLLGAAEKLRSTMGMPIPPADQREYNDCLRALSAQMDERERKEAWRKGAAMTIEQSLAFALET